MDAETEQVEEQTDIPAAPAEETPPETKNRPGKHLYMKYILYEIYIYIYIYYIPINIHNVCFIM